MRRDSTGIPRNELCSNIFHKRMSLTNKVANTSYMFLQQYNPPALVHLLSQVYTTALLTTVITTQKD